MPSSLFTARGLATHTHSHAHDVMYSYTQLVGDNAHKHVQENITLIKGFTAEEGKRKDAVLKGPPSCWEEGLDIFWKSLGGEKQINVEGELLEVNFSVVANGSRPSREFSQRNPSTCPPHFPSVFFFLSASLSD